MRKFLFCLSTLVALCFASPAVAATKADVNLNNADCIKGVSNVGSDTFVNICTGAHSIVPWGTADWMSAIALTTLVGSMLLAIVGGMTALVVSLIRNG